MHSTTIDGAVYFDFLHFVTAVLDKSVSWRNWNGMFSDIGSVSSISHGNGFVVENVVVFSVGPLQS